MILGTRDGDILERAQAFISALFGGDACERNPSEARLVPPSVFIIDRPARGSRQQKEDKGV